MKKKHRSESKAASHFIGIDVGGTKTLLALVSKSGHVNEFFEFKTPRRPAELLKKLVRHVSFWTASNSVAGIGVGIAGLVDSKQGVVFNSFNLFGQKRFELRNALVKKFGLPVVIENDANAWAFGEYMDLRKKPSCLAVLTFGTGVGCGLVVDGRIFHGLRFASEFGSIVVNPSGRHRSGGVLGTLESESNIASVMDRARKENLRVSEPFVVDQLARKKNKRAIRVLGQTGYWAGIGIANLVCAVQPQVVVLAGGLANSDCLVLKAIQTAKKMAAPGLLEGVSIQKTRLRNFGCAIGAAFLAQEASNNTKKSQSFV